MSASIVQAHHGPGAVLSGTRDRVELVEYGDALVRLTAAEASALRRASAQRLMVLADDEPDQWRLRATSFVGTVVTPDVEVLIAPKVTTTNLFHLLEASGKPIAVTNPGYAYDTAPGLASSFATFYATAAEAALVGGVPRRYEEYDDRLTSVRGRIDLPMQIRLAGLPLPVSCTFDEYTADTQLTRVLRAAGAALARLPSVPMASRRRLRRLDVLLTEAGQLRPADLRTEHRFTRIDEHCRAADRLARVALRAASITNAAGAAHAASFLVDMNKVFEDFVTARLRRHLSPAVGVHGQYRTALDTLGEIDMQPDLVLAGANGTPCYVADIKYKLTTDGLGRESDYYQLLAYTAALGLPEGLLIYCQHDGTAPATEIEVRHLGTRLRTWAIRLDRSPADVDDELRALAAHLLERAMVQRTNASRDSA